MKSYNKFILLVLLLVCVIGVAYAGTGEQEERGTFVFESSIGTAPGSLTDTGSGADTGLALERMDKPDDSPPASLQIDSMPVARREIVQGTQTLTFGTYSGYNLDQYLFYPNTIDFPIEVDLQGSSIDGAKLILRVWDVDALGASSVAPEVDNVYINDVYVGRLDGADDQWSINTFPLDPALLQNGANQIHIEIDVLTKKEWAVECDYGELILDVSEGPTINEITFSPSIPVTDKETTFTVTVNEVPGYEITGYEWDFMEDNQYPSSLDERLGGKNDPTNPQKKIWKSGKYGEKRLEVKLFGKKTDETEPYELDRQEIVFKVFFPMGGPADYKTNTRASPLNWAKDQTITVSEPNWYHYWKADGAVEKIDETIYDPATDGAGYYDSSSKTLALGKMAPRLWKTVTLTTGLHPSGETIGGTVGITGATATVFHEIHHQTISDEVKFSGLADSDYNLTELRYNYIRNGVRYYSKSNDELPDAFENGTLTTTWEPKGSLTNISHTDSYGMRNHFGGSYLTYGDNEYLCYREENRAIGRVESTSPKYDYTKDWSDGSRMAEEQAAAYSTASIEQIQSINRDSTEEIILITEEAGISEFISYNDYGVDTTGDGLFNTLNVDVTYSAEYPGVYSIAGDLTADGMVIAGTANLVELESAGTYQGTLIFDGATIQSSGKNGPYHLNVRLSESGGREKFLLDDQIDAHTTAAYSLSQFEGAQIGLSGSYTDSGIDLNGDGVYDILRVTSGLTVTEPGTYQVSAELYKNDDFITTTYTEATYSIGSQTVDLSFGGKVIGTKGIDGPYELRNVAVRDSGDVLMDYAASPYTTGMYSAAEFRSGFLSFLGNYSDSGIDETGSGKFDKLRIVVPAQVTDAGTYTITASLLDQNGNKIETVTTNVLLGTGAQTIPLDFSGRTISSHGADGPFILASLSAETETGAIADSIATAYTTNPYLVTDFEGSDIYLTGHYSSVGVDTDGDGLYDYLDITLGVFVTTGGTYRANAVLVAPNGNEIEWVAINEYLPASSINNLTFRFNGQKINGAGVSGSFSLNDLSIYHSSDQTQRFTKDQVYSTGIYAYTDFEQAGVITGVVKTEYGVPVSSANIVISGVSSTTSDADGYYSLGVTSSGTYTVTTNPIETYLSVNTTSIMVTAGETTVHNPILTSSLDKPTILSVTPEVAPNTDSTAVTIEGTGFESGATIKLTRSGEADIAATGVTVPSSTVINCTLPLNGAATGNWSLLITNKDGQSGELIDGFTVESAPMNELNGVYRNGQWIVKNPNTGQVLQRYAFGTPTDIPVVIDGKAAVYRNGQWIVRNPDTGQVLQRYAFGTPTDIPIVVDGKAAVYRNGQWIVRNPDTGQVLQRYAFGTPTDKPVTGIIV